MRSVAHGAALGALVALAATLAACAPKRSAALMEARSAYQAAAQDPQVTRYAPVQLHEAEQALRQAENAWDDDERDETRHLSYVAQRRVEIARAAARKEMADEATRTAQQSRAEVLLESREREIEALRSRETARGTVVTVPDVLFEFGRAELKPGAMQNLYRLVETLKQSPGRRVVIEGHTDNVGSPSANRALSERRAEAVAAFFTRNGVDPSRITTRGLGEGYPVASNTTEAGRQENRRVDIVIERTGRAGRATSGVGAGRGTAGTREEGGGRLETEPVETPY